MYGERERDMCQIVWVTLLRCESWQPCCSFRCGCCVLPLSLLLLSSAGPYWASLNPWSKACWPRCHLSRYWIQTHLIWFILTKSQRQWEGGRGVWPQEFETRQQDKSRASLKSSNKLLLASHPTSHWVSIWLSSVFLGVFLFLLIMVWHYGT